MRDTIIAAAAAAAALLWPAPAARAGGAPPVIVFAAASLKTTLDAQQAALDRAARAPVRLTYAASSTLARQIEAGAPAGVFVSADVDWMDYLDARGLIRRGTRVPLLGNRLVLVAPAGRAPALAIGPRLDLRLALGGGRLAVADPTVVPAGKYARAALTALGAWTGVAGRLAPAEHVRAALLLVSRGEAPLGIVYRTDALADAGVAIVGTFPESSHPPIVYPAALTATAGPGAERVLAALQSADARRAFERDGFTVLAAVP